MRSLLLCVTLTSLAAHAETAVFVSKRGVIPAYEAQKYAEQLTGALKVAGIPVVDADEVTKRLKEAGVIDTTTCSGKRPCAAELGAKLHVESVIALMTSEIGSDRMLTFEAVSVADGSLVAKDAVVVEKNAGLTLDALGQFVQKIRTAMTPAAPPVATVKPADVPTKTDVAPSGPPVEAVVVEPASSSSRVPAYVAGGAGAAALIAGAVLGIVALTTNGRLVDSVPDGVNSTLTYKDATALRDTANTMATASLTSLLVGAALGAATVVLW